MKKKELTEKLKAYGSSTLSNKESKGQERKKRRKVRGLRHAIRKQQAARLAELHATLEEEDEKQKILDEYLASEDAEVVEGA